jgi:hypothetical protein
LVRWLAFPPAKSPAPQMSADVAAKTSDNTLATI